LGSADSHAGNERADTSTSAAAPTAAAAPMQAASAAGTLDTAAAWNTCLQDLDGPALQVQRVPAAWVDALPTREGLCLQRDGVRWRAAWSPRLTPEDFLDAAGNVVRIRELQALLRHRGLYGG